MIWKIDRFQNDHFFEKAFPFTISISLMDQHDLIDETVIESERLLQDQIIGTWAPQKIRIFSERNKNVEFHFLYF